MRGHRRWIAVGLLLSVMVAACGSDSDAAGSSASGSGGAGGNIDLVAYSTPKEAFQPLKAAFTKTPAGRGVTFTESYGGSGDQSRAVVAGQHADFVDFSLEPDMDRLVK